jgi:hypothetical protein
MNYVELCNEVLVATNEVTLSTAGADFVAARGIQKTVKNAINTSIRDIYNEELNWPFAYTSGTQALTPGTFTYALPTSMKSVDWESFFIDSVEELTNTAFTSDITSWTDISAGSGSAAYNSSGNGVARLTGDGTDLGGLTQSITTVAQRSYRVGLRHLSNGLIVKIGTTSGGTEIKTETITLDNAGEGELKSFVFTATGATTFISITNTSTTAVDVDYIKCKEDTEGQRLEHIDFTTWRDKYKSDDSLLSPDSYDRPKRVYATLNDEFGVSSVPHQANWQVSFDYYAPATEMTLYDSSHSVPTRYEQAIISRARYYVLSLRSDPAFADRANKEFKEIMHKMRIELINKPTYFSAASTIPNTRVVR